MARTDWAAVLTEPAAEYIAQTELTRFGLTPYLPQIKKRHHTRPGTFVMRCYPLFPRYILVRINHADHPAIRMARGVTRYRPVLADNDGHPWRAPHDVIEAVREAERRGDFDEILHKGDAVTLHCGVLAMVQSILVQTNSPRLAELLMPLFGGARATVDPAQLTNGHAAT
jgi:hypothetical protein